MGQYYRIINVDKKQAIHPFDFGNSQKLTEWSYDLNKMVLTLMNLLGGEWKGDRVYVVGDYADTSDPEEAWCATLDAALEELECESLYKLAHEITHIVPESIKREFEHDDGPIPVIIGCTVDNGYRYIYNHATRQFIDMTKCPIEWIWFDNEAGKARATRFAPLPLLLAMGNGRGSGDYRNASNEHLVGSWCATSASIEVSKEPLGTATNYDEFAPDFTENRQIIPYTQLDEKIAEAMESRKEAEGVV